MYETYYQNRLQELNAKFDDDYGLPMLVLQKWGGTGGYHTRYEGNAHDPRLGAEYAELVYRLYAEQYYPRAEKALRKIAELQDSEETSPTFGLWSYYAEEPLPQMIAPDFNWADFICRHLSFVMKKRINLLPADLADLMRQTMRRGAACSIRRNVGCDYTNISFMSLNTIVGAAEVSGDPEMLAYARARMRKVLDFDRYSGAFCEYNSPAYTPLALEETSRMRMLFEDPECLAMAEELDAMGWRMLAMHYVQRTQQLAPPHMRAYSDFCNPSLEMLIYVGTNGKYGHFSEENISMTLLPYHCPEELYPYFEPVTAPRTVNETFYRRNNLREKEENTVIVRNLNSPDLSAMTYITPDYSMGAFRVCDAWVQRHNCMVIFGDGQNRTALRLRCMKQDTQVAEDYIYDTCMGFVTADMRENVLLGQASLVTDHGDFHYILDKVKNGVYTLDGLSFRFVFTGDTEGLTAEKTESGFRFCKDGITLSLAVFSPLADGKPIVPVWDAHAKAVILPLLSGRQTVDLAGLSESLFTFTLTVNGTAKAPVLAEQDGVRTATLDGLCVRSYRKPNTYDRAVALAVDGTYHA